MASEGTDIVSKGCKISATKGYRGGSVAGIQERLKAKGKRLEAINERRKANGNKRMADGKRRRAEGYFLNRGDYDL